MIVANMSAVTYKSFFSNFIDFLTEITSTDELYSILNEPPKQKTKSQPFCALNNCKYLDLTKSSEDSPWNERGHVAWINRLRNVEPELNSSLMHC